MDIKTEEKGVSEKQDTLLVLDKEKNKVEAVKGIDKNGELQIVSPEQKHNNDFLKLDRGGDVASNFLKNFMSQLKDPTRFEFFKADRENVEKIAKQIKEHVKSPTDSSKAKLDKIKVDVEAITPFLGGGLGRLPLVFEMLQYTSRMSMPGRKSLPEIISNSVASNSASADSSSETMKRLSLILPLTGRISPTRS